MKLYVLALTVYLFLLGAAYWASVAMNTPQSNRFLLCAPITEGTDYYYECVIREPLDLTPIQDEAQTTISQERN